MYRYLVLFLLITCASNMLFSQEKQMSVNNEKRILEKAEFYYENGESKNTARALSLFKRLHENKPEDPYYKLMVGICNGFFKKGRAKSLEMLLEVKAEHPDFSEIDFYVGKAYALNNRFDDAINSYQEYIQSKDVSDDQKSLARQNIVYCENAKEYLQDTVGVEIKSIGLPINTEYSEYVPVITPDESILIYTYRGERSKGGLRGPTGKPDPDGQYNEDIMVSYKLGNRWLEPESIDDNINSSAHDASIALSVDGQALFVYKHTKKNGGDIYVSEFSEGLWSKPSRLRGEINTESWEGSATLSSDGKTMYFASDRPGGFGGRDLYSAVLQPDLTWSEITNLGPVINTKLDDDAPFIHPDRRTLYYSSKGHNSMGGYDIFYSYLSDEGWDEPKNMGYPINSTSDDRYYVLSADAKTGYYSTAGRSEDGTHDIYTVSPGHFGKAPVLALVVGVTKADGEPAEADITVTDDKTGDVAGRFKSNSENGKYILALTPGNKYKIAIEVEGHETKIDYIDVESLESYVEVKHNFNLHSKDNPLGIDNSEGADKLQDKIDEQIDKYKQEALNEQDEALIYADILTQNGDLEREGVEYFLDAECVDMDKANPEMLAKINTVSYPDGTSKKIIGPFKTLLEAEVVKHNLVKEDSLCKDLEVRVNDEGKEKTIKQYYSYEFNKKPKVSTAGQDELSFINPEEGTIVNPDSGEEEKEVAKADDKSLTGLTFKVEIAAVEDKNDFKYQHLEKYGKITAKTYPDGITRYTFGPFETLVEAENFRKMIEEREKMEEDAFVTVFVFDQRKTVEEYKKSPCELIEPTDFSWFVGKDLNDKEVYNKLIKTGGNICAKGLEFRVQIAAYRFPKNYKWNHLKQFGKPSIINYPDGITRFTQDSFNTLSEAEILRQRIIASGQKDAWVTPFYNGKRMLMEELIAVNFYSRSIN